MMILKFFASTGYTSIFSYEQNEVYVHARKDVTRLIGSSLCTPGYRIRAEVYTGKAPASGRSTKE